MKPVILLDGIHRATMAPRVHATHHDLLHLRQGDGDGACGAYCAWMALMICGAVRREDVESLETDRRTRFGKFLKGIEEGAFGPFLRKGSHQDALAKLVNKSFGILVEATPCEDQSPAAVRQFIIQSLQDDAPVLVGVEGKKISHWLLGIGLELERGGRVRSILLLDPLSEAPPLCAWNAVLELRKGGRKHRLIQGNGGRPKVVMDEAVRIQPIS